MRTLIGVALGVTALLSMFIPEPAAAQQLSSSQLSAITSGKAHRGTNQRGGVFVFNYMADGSLSGVLEGLANKGVSVQWNDQGRWWIAGNKLCVQWSKWRKGKKHCGPVATNGSGYRYGSGVAFTID